MSNNIPSETAFVFLVKLTSTLTSDTPNITVSDNYVKGLVTVTLNANTPNAIPCCILIYATHE